MSRKILVTYATRNGSTAGVADAIGQALNNDGTQVDVLAMEDVQDLAPYRAVVAGSAIQSSSWLPEAIEFVQSHRVQLSQKPFAAFLVCMTLAMKNEKWREQADVASFMAPVRALVRPVSEGFFAGALTVRKVEPVQARIGFRISVLTRVWSEGDHRDWAAIQGWAESLKPLLSS